MTVFYSGNINGRHGVVFIVKEYLIKLIKKKIEAVDDRLCYLIIDGKPFIILFILYYYYCYMHNIL